MCKMKISIFGILLILCTSSFFGCAVSNNEQKTEQPVEDFVADVEWQSTLPTIYVENAEAAPGNTVQIAVKIRNNPGILGMSLSVYYDETQCTLQKSKSGKALKGVLDFTASKDLKSGARFVWDGTAISEADVRDGEILVMTFKVHKKADKKICPITLKYFEDDIVDNNLVSIYPQIENGAILIAR